MPKTRRALGSSPIEAPSRPTQPVSKSAVKRSAPQANLLTPPRTVHKRKRGDKTPRSRRHDSDSDEREGDQERDDASGHESERRPNGAVMIGNKKRKTLDAIAEELSGAAAAEDAFWLGTSDADNGAGAGSSKQQKSLKEVRLEDGERGSRARSRSRSPSSSPPPAPHLLQRSHTGLISPPPSRRQPRVVPRPATPPPNPPSLRRSPRRFRNVPVRDSPDNPFLVSHSPGSAASASPQTPEPRTPVQHVEKPTITYVFRGVKAVLPNPLYRPPGASPDEAERRSRLPLDHPDYSPAPACAPKLLFPEARRHDHARRMARSQVAAVLPETPTRQTRSQVQAGKTRARSAPGNSSWDSSDDEPESLPVPEPPRATKVEQPVGEDALQAAMAERVAKRLSAAAERARGNPPRTRSRAQASDRPP